MDRRYPHADPWGQLHIQRSPLLRIVECLYVMEQKGEISRQAQVARVTFLVEEDVPARGQHLR